jgi:hypothetical protein
MKMARKTKKMQTDIQLPVLRIQNSDSVFPSSNDATPELDVVLASVFRVFVARGRAIRASREKQKSDGLQNKDA